MVAAMGKTMGAVEDVAAATMPTAAIETMTIRKLQPLLEKCRQRKYSATNVGGSMYREAAVVSLNVTVSGRVLLLGF